MTTLPPIEAGADMSDALECRLRPYAERARGGDRSARDALYTTLRPKLVRMEARWKPPAGATWTAGDVAQEGWLVFDALVRSWSPAKPFGRYVLANYPYRLRDAVMLRLNRPSVPPRMTTVPIDGLRLADPTAGDAFDRAILHTLADTLKPIEAELMRRRILEGEELVTIAREIGVSRCTATRHWRSVRRQLQAA